MQWLRDVFPLKPVRCPGCRLRISGECVWDRLTCPACGAVFNIRRFYVASLYALALALGLGMAYSFGVRGNPLTSVSLMIALPTARAMLAISRRLFPPDVELVAAGWTPGDSEEDQEVEVQFERLRELDVVIGPAPWDEPPPALGEWRDDTPGRSRLAGVTGPPVTVEGVLLVIAFAALVAYHVFVAIEPHITRR